MWRNFCVTQAVELRSICTRIEALLGLRAFLLDLFQGEFERDHIGGGHRLNRYKKTTAWKESLFSISYKVVTSEGTA